MQSLIRTLRGLHTGNDKFRHICQANCPVLSCLPAGIFVYEVKVERGSVTGIWGICLPNGCAASVEGWRLPLRY